MAVSRQLVAVVPSIGRSPFALEALERLRAELARARGELLWVSPRSAPPPAALGGGERGERWLELDRAVGFAAAVNRGIRASGAELVALVNDDCLLEPGALELLCDELRRDVRLGAAQGVVVELNRAGEALLCDGCGVGWNGWWQAVQVGRGAPAPAVSMPPFELFGVQATAAVYRRTALERVSTGRARPFDERLESWYEDVDLAGRLRAAGFGARTVPSARSLHAGSTTGATMPFRRRRLLTRNRILVVARFCGRRFPLALPRLAVRDLIDGARAVARGELGTLAALGAGWLGAVPLLPAFLSFGAQLVSPRELARFPTVLPIGSTE